MLGTTTATGAGTWSLITPVLAEGARSFTATATNASGATSASSASFTVIVDTAPPAAPVIASVTDDLAPATGPLANGAATNDTTLTLTGTAEAGSLVAIRDGGVLLGTTTASATGSWSFTTPSLGEGPRSFTATATDPAGNVSAASAPRAVVIDTVAPVAPAITAVTDDLAPVTGHVANGGRTNDPTLTLSGTAEAGSLVTIRDGEVVIGTTTATGTGIWSFTTGVLANGMHSFGAFATDAAGNVSATATHVVVIDTVPPGTPTITTIVDNLAPYTGSLATGGTTNDNTLAVSGIGESGSTIILRNGTEVVGTGTASAFGAWTIVTMPLPDGPVQLSATAMDAAGNASAASAAIPLTIDTTAPAAPTILGPAAPASEGEATQPILTGTAEPGAVITLYDDATLLGTTQADGAGTWSFATSLLANATYSIVATATDAAGNTSALSAPLVPQMALKLDKTALWTSEAGGSDTLLVQAINVTAGLGELIVSIDGLDATEGSLSSPTLVLNAANNWTATLAVTGTDDRDVDGAQDYGLNLSAPGLATVAIAVNNADDDIAPDGIGTSVLTNGRRTTIVDGGADGLLAAKDGAALVLQEGGASPTSILAWTWSFSGLGPGDHRLQIDASSTGEAFRFITSVDGGASWLALRDAGRVIPFADTWDGSFLVTGITDSLLVRIVDQNRTTDTGRDSFTVDLLTLEPVPPPSATDLPLL